MIEVQLPDGRVIEIDTDDRAAATNAAKRFLATEQGGAQTANFEGKSNPIQQDDGLKRKGGILPLSRDLQTGELNFDPSAGLIGALVEGVTLPRDVMTGQTPVFDETGRVSEEVAGRALAAQVATPASRAVSSSAKAIPPAVVKQIKRATSGVSDREFARASKLQSSAQARGTTLLGPEAIDSPALQQLASNVKQSQSGGPVIDRATVGRQAGLTRIAERDIDTVAPRGSTPASVARQTKDAATGVLDEAGQFRAGQTRPLFDAADAEDIPASELKPVFEALDGIKVARGSPVEGVVAEMKQLLLKEDGTAETNAGILNQVFQQMRDRIDITDFRSASGADKAVRAQLKGPVKRLKAALEQSASIAEGRALHKHISEELNNPLERGDIGELAKTKNFKKIRATLLDPDNARPKETYATMRILGDVAPELPSRILRIHLEGALNKALKPTQGGATNIGPKFSQAVAGTPLQSQLIRSMFRALEDQRGLQPGTLANGFFKSLKILDRTGRIPGVGSQTQPRQALAAELAQGGRAAAVVGAADITKGSFIGQARNTLRQWVQDENYEELARIFTNPDSVGLIKSISRRKGLDAPKSVIDLAALLAVAQQTSNTGEKSNRGLLPNEV